MKKLYSSFALSLALMAAATSSASAEGIHLGYCDGNLPTSGMSYGSAGNTIDAAIFITPDLLLPYADCQISSLYVGLTPDLSAYPETITGWLRTQKEGTNIVEAQVSATGGWLTIDFATPVNIADYTGEGIWAGFEYVQPSKMKVLAIEGQTGNENAAWVAKNGKWVSFKNQGVLPIEAIVTGDNLPRHDLAITSCELGSQLVKLGTQIRVSGEIKNRALEKAINPIIRLTLGDKVVDQTINTSLVYRQTRSFSAIMPLDEDDMEEREATLRVEILWADDVADDYAADNVVELPVTLAKDVFIRQMVVEEATGAWCGFCVRGIVALREMKAKYPDTFIGMAVHNGDPYVVSAYDNWIGSFISGYPSCLVNRDGKVYDPSFAELDRYMKAMTPTSTVGIDLQASYAGSDLTVSAKIDVLADISNANYRLAFVVLEDQLPITQSNYYSGGGYGPMGGFESMGSSCNILVDDVVRGIFPAPAGEVSSVPATLTKGEPYTFTKSYKMCAYTEASNVSVVALLIDTASKQIVNACKTERILGLNYTAEDTDGIERVQTDAAARQCFDLRGQRLAAPQQGINVVGGRVVFIAD